MRQSRLILDILLVAFIGFATADFPPFLKPGTGGQGSVNNSDLAGTPFARKLQELKGQAVKKRREQQQQRKLQQATISRNRGETTQRQRSTPRSLVRQKRDGYTDSYENDDSADFDPGYRPPGLVKRPSYATEDSYEGHDDDHHEPGYESDSDDHHYESDDHHYDSSSSSSSDDTYRYTKKSKKSKKMKKSGKGKGKGKGYYSTSDDYDDSSDGYDSEDRPYPSSPDYGPPNQPPVHAPSDGGYYPPPGYEEENMEFVMERYYVGSNVDENDFGLGSGIGINGEVFDVVYYDDGGRGKGDTPIGVFKTYCIVTSTVNDEMLCKFEIAFYTVGYNGFGAIIATGPVSGAQSVNVVTGAEYDFERFTGGEMTTLADADHPYLFAYLDLTNHKPKYD